MRAVLERLRTGLDVIGSARLPSSIQGSVAIPEGTFATVKERRDDVAEAEKILKTLETLRQRK